MISNYQKPLSNSHLNDQSLSHLSKFLAEVIKMKFYPQEMLQKPKANLWYSKKNSSKFEINAISLALENDNKLA